MKLYLKIILPLTITFLFSANLKSQCDWTLYDMGNSGLPNNYVNDIEVDHDGNLWMATDTGIAVYDGFLNWQLHNASTGLYESSIPMLEVDNNGNIWAGTYNGVYRFDTAWTVYNSLNSSLLGDEIVDVEPDNYGGIWFSADPAAKSDGVTYFDGNNIWYTFTQDSGLVSNNIIDITIDAYDNVWFASGEYPDTGITKFTGTNWITYKFADTIPLIYINKIEADMDGNIWILTSMNNVIKFDGTNAEIFDYNNSPLSDYINCVEVDMNENIWFGTYLGAHKYDGTTWTTYNTSNGLPSDLVYDIEIDLDGNIWFATSMGVAKLDVKASLQVYVNYEGSMLDYHDIALEIYSPTYPVANGSDSLFAVIDTFMQTTFMFENIEPGNYYIKAVVKPGTAHLDMINSYYTNDTITTYNWEEASIVSLFECDWQNIILNMAFFPIDIGTGNGIFSGNISYDDGNNKSAGEPVPGAEVYIEQEPNDEPVLNTETDSLGDYIVDGIPEGLLFKIFVDIPGFPMLTTYSNLEITATELSITDLDFIVDTLIHIADNSGIININEQFAVNVFPNPFTDKLNIEYELDNYSFVNILMFDENGKTIKRLINEKQTNGKHSISFYANNISNGVYYLKITLDNISYLKKVVFTK